MKPIAVLIGIVLFHTLGAADTPPVPPYVSSKFIFEKAPFASCHAMTLVETKSGLVAAWFAGTREGAPDVCIWSSRQVDGKWSEPVEVAKGLQADGTSLPCWNPVLFQPSLRPLWIQLDRPLMLFYKIGPSPSKWWGMLRTSSDEGITWSEAKRLPDGILGPIKNKPVELQNGNIICPASTETDGWRVHFEISPDKGKTWRSVSPASETAGKDGKPINAIQPSVLTAGLATLIALGRTKEGKIFRTWSPDNGQSWQPLELTQLPNPNSGTDAVTLKDGRHLLVYNHTSKGRSPLNVAISKDGVEWSAALVLENEPGEYSYPCVIQTSDGLVHIGYTWHRSKIKHVVLDPKKLELTPMVDGAWPK